MRNTFALLGNLHRSIEVLRCVRESDQWASLTRAYLGLRDLNYPYSLQIRGLQTVEVREITDVWAFWQIFLRRIYEVRGTEKHIVDAGANIGFFALWAARNAPAARILCIEPAPDTYERLVENIRRNGLQDRVTCVQAALAGVAEVRAMEVGQPKSQARRVLPNSPNGNNKSPVLTATLAQVLEEHGFNSVDLLKMDIEGGEFETLLSTPEEVLRRVDSVSLEYHPDVEGYTPAQLLHHLEQVGFRIKSDRRNREGFGVAVLKNSRFR